MSEERKKMSNSERARCGGLVGGLAKTPTKGFGSPEVLAKALETRRANYLKRKQQKEQKGGE